MCFSASVPPPPLPPTLNAVAVVVAAAAAVALGFSEPFNHVKSIRMSELLGLRRVMSVCMYVYVICMLPIAFM